MKNMKFYANSEIEVNVNDMTGNEEIWKNIVSYMDDEIREATHSRMFRECEKDSCEEFLRMYLEADEEFIGIIENEFGFTYEV